MRTFLIFSLLFLSAFSLKIPFWVALKTQNVDILRNTALEVSNPRSNMYGRYLSTDSINDLTAPAPSDVSVALQWLQSEEGIHCNHHGDSISCVGDRKSVERLFDIKMYYNQKYNRYHSLEPYKLPDSVDGIVLFVEGISNPLYPDPNPIKTEYQLGETYLPYVAREVVNRLYGLDDPTIIHNASVCAAEFMNANGFFLHQLRHVQKVNGMPPIDSITVVGEHSFNMSTESNLDLQMMAQTLQHGNIWYWGAPHWMYSFAVELLNAEEVPQVISISWGWAEDEQCTINPCDGFNSEQYIDRTNIEFMKVGLRGITLVAASGDAGAPGRTSESCKPTRAVNPVFPGSSPWVISVSGTYLSDNEPPYNSSNWQTPFCKENGCATGSTSLPCNFLATQWTTGGGFSIYTDENRPPWQDDAVSGYLKSGVPLPLVFNEYGRGYPDVSMNGHFCPTFLMEILLPVDGTSCAAPLFASFLALMNDHQIGRGKPVLGIAGPLLYEMWYDDNSTFVDLTEGNNWCTESECCPLNTRGGSDFGYEATNGWDPVTGLGEPNLSVMLEWLDSNVFYKCNGFRMRPTPLGVFK